MELEFYFQDNVLRFQVRGSRFLDSTGEEYPEDLKKRILLANVGEEVWEKWRHRFPNISNKQIATLIRKALSNASLKLGGGKEFRILAPFPIWKEVNSTQKRRRSDAKVSGKKSSKNGL